MIVSGELECELERQKGEVAKKGMLEIEIMGNERLGKGVGQDHQRTGSQESKKPDYGNDLLIHHLWI